MTNGLESESVAATEPASVVSTDAGSELARRRARMAERIARVGIAVLFVGMLVVFSLLRPENFPTINNAKAILEQAAILGILGVGLTVVLVIREFDLSFDANAALSGAFAAYVMTSWGLPTAPGLALAILAGGLVGVANGSIVAFGKAPAFIGTLAVASLAVGIQSWFTGDQTIYGVPEAYIGISTGSIFGIPLFIVISLAVVAAITVLLRFTVYGRHAHAVGSNPKAAASAGVRVREVRWFAFVVLGCLAGLAGALLTAQGGGSVPGATAGMLLPVYTAAFLGASAWGKGTFTATGTFFGVIFIGTLSTGLTMLQQPTWVSNLITGGVLVAAVLLARRQ